MTTESTNAAVPRSPSVRTVRVPLRDDRRAGPVHAFTVDVEDWYQSCIDYDAPITERVVRNVDRLLAVLDANGVKGTFFVQGRVAEAFPRLVQTVVAEGHEVQSHGYSHRPLFRMGPAELRDELERARATVEDAAGRRVTAFRAQDFSILSENLWALETLRDVGFDVDSSIFPVRMSRYGIGGWEVFPHRVSIADSVEILEVPVAVWARGRVRIPVAGGGYFRVLPAALLDRAYAAVGRERPGVVYCHPYEFNADELDEYRGTVSSKYLWAQNLGRRSFVPRLVRLLRSHRFGRFDETLAAWGIA